MSNRSQTWLPALVAAAAGTVNGETVLNPDGDSAHVVVNVTALTGTSPTLTVFVEAYDIASQTWYVLLQSAALSAANAAGSPTVLKIIPTGIVTANLVANDVLPEKVRVRAVVGGTGVACSATFGGGIYGGT